MGSSFLKCWSLPDYNHTSDHDQEDTILSASVLQESSWGNKTKQKSHSPNYMLITKCIHPISSAPELAVPRHHNSLSENSVPRQDPPC